MGGGSQTAGDWPGERVDVFVRLERLTVTVGNIETRVDELLTLIRGQVCGIDKRVQTLEDQVPDNLGPRVAELEKLAPVMRGVLWFAGVLGVSVLALIWALITGQAVLAFQ